jgi:hypothetical protein
VIQFIIPSLAAAAVSVTGLFLLPSRLPPFLARLLIAFVCWLGLAGSQWAVTQVPDFSTLGFLFPNQVWQRILGPLGLVFLWSAFIESIGAKLSDATRLVTYILAFGLAIYASLPFAPIWEDLVPENALWLLASLSASICSAHTVFLMLSDERTESGKRWAIWSLVANFGAIAGVMLSQIGSLGEWCIAAMLMVGVFAAAISISGNSTWVKSIVPPFCLLAGCLVSNIRFNATEVKPWWLFVTLFFMPTVIAMVDLLLENRMKKPIRLVISATLCFVTTGTVVGFVWLSSSPSESW